VAAYGGGGGTNDEKKLTEQGSPETLRLRRSARRGNPKRACPWTPLRACCRARSTVLEQMLCFRLPGPHPNAAPGHCRSSPSAAALAWSGRVGSVLASLVLGGRTRQDTRQGRPRLQVVIAARSLRLPKQIRQECACLVWVYANAVAYSTQPHGCMPPSAGRPASCSQITRF
jgi:hypothetical protein